MICATFIHQIKLVLNSLFFLQMYLEAAVRKPPLYEALLDVCHDVVLQHLQTPMMMTMTMMKMMTMMMEMVMMMTMMMMTSSPSSSTRSSRPPAAKLPDLLFA